MKTTRERINAIVADCRERLPSLEKYGSEARASRALLRVINHLHVQTAVINRTRLAFPDQPTPDEAALEAIADAWDADEAE